MPRTATAATPLLAVDKDNLDEVCALFGHEVRRWCAAHAFAGEPGRFVLVPGKDGTPAAVLAGCDRRATRCTGWPRCRCACPKATTRSIRADSSLDEAAVALGWALGSYQFDRYRKATRKPARLAVEQRRPRIDVLPIVEAICRVRDLVNTPTEDMGPAELAGRGARSRRPLRRKLSRMGRRRADRSEFPDDPRRRPREPSCAATCRADLRGRADAPHLVLIGKGVCFDTGGLDIKPADGMRWMKKDMGGAAHAIALAELVLHAKLPVRLTLLVPAVENCDRRQCLSSRRSDPHARRTHRRSRQHRRRRPPRALRRARLRGRAEARPDPRLRHADRRCTRRARPRACRRCSPIATTSPRRCSPQRAKRAIRSGACRYGARILRCSIRPSPTSPTPVRSRHAGAITAALYLERFVPEAQAWCHLDVYSWNDSERPGRPRGGEAQGLRAYFEFLRERYA